MYIAHLILVITFVFFFLYKRNFANDTYNYIMAADRVFGHEKLCSRLLLEYGEKGVYPNYHPPFFLFIVHLFRKTIQQNYLLIQKILTFGHLVLINYLLSYAFDMTLYLHVLSSVVFMTYWIVVMESFYITDRPIAHMLATVYAFVFFFSELSFSHEVFLLTGLIMLHLFVHKHSLQWLLVFSIFTLFIQDYAFLVSFLFAIIIASIFSKGYNLKIHKDHLKLVRWAGRNLKDKKTFLENLKNNNIKVKESFKSLIRRYSMLSHAFLAVGILLFLDRSVEEVLIFFITLSLVFIVNHISFFCGIGDGYRYAQYLVFPIIIVIIKYLPRELDWIVILFSLPGIYFLISSTRNSFRSYNFQKIKNYFSESKFENKNIFSFFPEISYLIAVEAKCNVLWFLSVSGFYKATTEKVYPALRADYEYLLKKYNIDYVIKKKADKNINLSKYKLIDTVDDFEIYEL